MHFLAFATNFKHETPYLREWIEYHLLVGVDHFYLYDQDGGEPAGAVLRPYEDRGIVTRHPWRQDANGTWYDRRTRFFERNKNHLAFAHAASNYRDRVEWLMKIDVDEFLYPLEGETLRPFLESLDRNVRGLRIPRIDFGSSGHTDTPPGPVIGSYLRREARPSNHKDMARGRYLGTNRFIPSAHWWGYRFWKGGRMLETHEVTGIRINHYYTKSRAEFLDRQNVSGGRRNTPADFEAIDRRCDAVTDDGMLRFVPGLERQVASD